MRRGESRGYAGPYTASMASRELLQELVDDLKDDEVDILLRVARLLLSGDARRPVPAGERGCEPAYIDARHDSVLREIWDNEYDAVYDEL